MAITYGGPYGYFQLPARSNSWPRPGPERPSITSSGGRRAFSSGAYASGRVGASHYCASKAGVVMFTRVLAIELAEQRINVNCIAPGYIKVDSGTSPPSSDFETALIKNTP